MSIFDSPETKFCKQLFKLICESKSDPIAHVLCVNKIFYEDTATLFPLFTFGYCMGALDIEFSHRYSTDVCDRLSHKLTDLFTKRIRRELLRPEIIGEARDRAISEVLILINDKRSYVSYVLQEEPKEEQLSLISFSYRESLNIKFYDLTSEAERDLDAAIKFMLDFSVLPFPYPVLR